MHIVDEALRSGLIKGPAGLLAWSPLEIPYTDPDSIRLTRTLVRPSNEVMRRIIDDMPEFLAEYGYTEHYDMARVAWTEDLDAWQTGITSKLVAPEVLFFMSWTARTPDGDSVRERVEAIALTDTQAVAVLHLGGRYTHMPMWMGIITRSRAPQSLSLLLSRKETRVMSPACVYAEFETDLRWPEPVRIGFASQRMYLPDVLTMSDKDLITLLGDPASTN